MKLIEISSCTECADCQKERYYKTDSFDTYYRFDCTCDDKNRNISKDDTWDKESPRVPEWCPRKINLT